MLDSITLYILQIYSISWSNICYYNTMMLYFNIILENMIVNNLFFNMIFFYETDNILNFTSGKKPVLTYMSHLNKLVYSNINSTC